ncbi:hypothetical protein [Mycobacterium intracellulare]|uniref:Uncharacterized protein n=1 Tax=Mycobacterium intracellulare TaxID=1767 RepID=A0AAE4RJQ7_MYCIT|nr:hypothetical protein [Mycobacterium intracellulare]MDV6979680.1 hypothetical protein [Mycobacterium intracellulare]MDV6985183.1 hypothetical protein [Mycobacterium intracellulare]MDV7014197.1 hypothetical protein [Mycobacterium intracellulare]MDV7030174.1 hypothetical protein [Mycobacterium intracellulare]
MRITLAVVLDDGTEIRRPVDVETNDGPELWGGGIAHGVDHALEVVRALVENTYGAAPDGR